MAPLRTYAADEADSKAAGEDTVYYDPTDYTQDDCSLGTGDVELLGKDRQTQAYNFFIAKGLTGIQAVGIMGNIQVESTFIPDQQEHGQTPPNGGYGIAQWTAERRTALVKAAEAEGLHPTVPAPREELQKLYAFEINYLWNEATQRGDIKELKKETTVQGAVVSWEKNFEVAGVPALGDRLVAANTFYDEFVKGGPGSGTGGGSTGSGGSTCAGDGKDTKFVDGFKIYSQYDPAWKDLPYGDSTIGISGCGPSAMAMIITNLTGKSVNPVATANYAAQRGQLVGGGSSWTIGPVLAEHWGLKSTFVGPDVYKITVALQKGGLVIAPGAGALPFTEGGHFIVIRAVTADGKWLVGDSAHDATNTQKWDPKTLVSEMREGGEYAIYK